MKNVDIELINRTLEGDDNAFSELVKKYQKQVHALAWRKVGDFHIAEDITQDTFLKAYQRLHTLKDPHQFSGWLYVIATRQCLAWFRNKGLQKKVLENIETEPTNRDSYSQHIIQEKTETADLAKREVVKKLLETLKESERTVITLHYFGDMTCEEMSKFLGVSANTIKSRLRRARNRLKKEEPMIREAISNFQISPTLTENVMKKITHTKPVTSSTSRPMIPWGVAVTSVVFIALMIGIGSQYFAHFQRPYSLESQTEMEVELVDAAIVKEVESINSVRNPSGVISDTEGKSNGDGENANQVSADQGDYTRWNLPEGAKRRLGRGEVTDTQISPDGKRFAVAGSIGVWLYSVNTGSEIALLSGHKEKNVHTIPRVIFSPDSKKIATSGYDNTIRIWNAETGKMDISIDMPKGPARLFRFPTDGRWSTHVIPTDQIVHVGDYFDYFNDNKTGSIQITPGGALKSLRFLPDSKTLMIQNLRGTIWLWNIDTEKELATFSPELPEPKLDEYKKWLRLHKLPNPEKWHLETDAFVNMVNGIDVKFAFAVGDKYGTISIRDSQTDEEILTLKPSKASTEKMDNNLTAPIQDRVRRPGTLRSTPNTIPSDWVKWISKLKFSPDGKTLVSWSDYRKPYLLNTGMSWVQGPTEIWNVITGERIGTLPLFESRRSDGDVEFSGDGKTLAITGKGGCSIWDIVARREIGSFSGDMDIKFSGDGKSFALIESEHIEIWDILTQHKIASIDTDAESIMLEPEITQWNMEPGKTVFSAISDDGSILAVMNRDGSVKIWQPRISTQLKTLTTGFTKQFTAFAFANHSNTLVSGDSVGNINIWDLNTGSEQAIPTSNKDKPIGGLAFATDDTTLTSECDGIIEVWNVNTRKQVKSHIILDAAGYGRTKMSTTFKSSYILFPHGLTVLTSEGGRIVAFSDFRHGDEGGIKVWDVSTGEHLCTIDEPPLGDIIIAFSRDGKTIATGDWEVVYLWDVHTGERLATLKMSKKQKFSRAVYAGAFTQDGNIFAVGGDSNERAIFLWNIATQEHIATLKGHEHAISQLEFSPNDKILASGDASGTIRLWDVSNAESLATFYSSGGSVSNLVFSPDGTTLASTTGGSSSHSPVGTIFLWDVPIR